MRKEFRSCHFAAFGTFEKFADEMFRNVRESIDGQFFSMFLMTTQTHVLPTRKFENLTPTPVLLTT